VPPIVGITTTNYVISGVARCSG